MSFFSWLRRPHSVPPPADAHVHRLAHDEVLALLQRIRFDDPATQQALLHVWQQCGVSAYLIGAAAAHEQITFDDCSLCAEQGLSTCRGHAYQVTPKHKDPS